MPQKIIVVKSLIEMIKFVKDDSSLSGQNKFTYRWGVTKITIFINVYV